jgi:hypothetical protein
VRKTPSLAIVCGLLLAIWGCGNKATVSQPAAGSEHYNDWRYTQSMMGLDPARGFGEYLQSLDPAERVKYINKSVEDGPQTRVYTLKSVYERFSIDSNAEVAAAAKEALTKVPSPEEYEVQRKEDIAKMSQ